MQKTMSKTSGILQKAELIYNATLLGSECLLMASLSFHFRQKTVLFRFRPGFSLLCLALFCLCVALGAWQWHRYVYKKALLATWHERLMDTPKQLNDIIGMNDLAFRAVRVQGHYLNALTFLVQNRFYQDEPGFEVLTPLQLAHDKKLLLVDRGWIKKPADNSLPAISPVTQPQNITGHIKLLDEYQFILGDNILQPNTKPIIVQRVDTAELGRITHQAFYPFILRLDANQPEGFVRDWTIVTVTPGRHLAYMIQWFAFALILLVGYICFCCEEKKNHAKNS